MSKGRVHSTRSKARRTVTDTLTKLQRYIGVSLGGGKTDRASVVVLEFYPAHGKLFLARVFEKIKTEFPESSADQKIYEILKQYEGEAKLLAFDVPLTLPKCLRCSLRCPGYEACDEPEIKWMQNFYEKVNEKRKPKKNFTPYTQRCAETYLGFELEEKFELQHALGANLAPLTARAMFLARRLKLKKIETLPKISIWRIGQNLRMNKSILRTAKHSLDGEGSRRAFLSTLQEKTNVFIYQQDFEILISNGHAFDAFIAAYTGYLSGVGAVEKKPSDFPRKESWIVFPTSKV